MHPCCAHEINIGSEARGRIDYSGPHVNHGVSEQSSSQHDDIDVLMFGGFHSDSGTVCDDRRAQVRGEMAGHLKRGGAAIQDDDLVGADHGSTGTTQLTLVPR